MRKSNNELKIQGILVDASGTRLPIGLTSIYRTGIESLKISYTEGQACICY